MAKIKIISDPWNLSQILVDEEGNKAAGGKIITSSGEILNYPIQKRIIDTANMLGCSVKNQGFVKGLFSKEIDTGSSKSPFSR